VALFFFSLQLSLSFFPLPAYLALSIRSASAEWLRCSRSRQRGSSRDRHSAHSVANCSSASIDVVFRARRENCEKSRKRENYSVKTSKTKNLRFELFVFFALSKNYKISVVNNTIKLSHSICDEQKVS